VQYLGLGSYFQNNPSDKMNISEKKTKAKIRCKPIKYMGLKKHQGVNKNISNKESERKA
jgi:hypothetical protein